MEEEQAAGLDTRSDYTAVSKIVRDSFQLSGIEVNDMVLENDGHITLYGILGHRPGVLAVSGTGSIVWGKAKGGASLRVGGWGHRISDDGSGYFIGLEALRHIFRSIDGQDPPSGIRQVVLETLQLSTTDDLLTWINGTAYSVEKVASITPSIFKLAHERDPAANGILQKAGQHLAHACITAIQKCHLDEDHFELIAVGSVLQKDALVLEAMLHAIKENYKDFTVRQLESEPIYCALLYGLRCLNGCNNDAMTRFIAPCFMVCDV
ncbi:BadF/BadG/BcrA/BcrD ATPase family protein [Scopulibacillus daqui]|nr:BadF/BadG/BcrA/BcrD ATPase family protein [Scopulibacillus daqui]